jgi:hypothetical protein
MERRIEKGRVFRGKTCVSRLFAHAHKEFKASHNFVIVRCKHASKMKNFPFVNVVPRCGISHQKKRFLPSGESWHLSCFPKRAGRCRHFGIRPTTCDKEPAVCEERTGPARTLTEVIHPCHRREVAPKIPGGKMSETFVELIMFLALVAGLTGVVFFA